MWRYKSHVLALNETRWQDFGGTKSQDENTFIYSGVPSHSNRAKQHRDGLGMLLNKVVKISLLEWYTE